MRYTIYQSLGMIVIAAIALFAPAAQGAAIDVEFVYIGSSDAGFSPLSGLPLTDDPSGVDPTDIHHLSLTIELSDMEPDEDFRSVQVDIVLLPGFSPQDYGIPQAYFATPLIYDPPGPDPASDAWYVNYDAGAAPADLKRITAILRDHDAAAALQPGEAGPLEIGQFSVNLDPAAADVYSFFKWFEIDVIRFTTTPEPATMTLLGLGSLILLGRRRRVVRAAYNQ